MAPIPDAANFMKRSLLPTALKVGLFALLFFVYLRFAQIDVIGHWDFRNNLWGPAHLLVTGRSPYRIIQLFSGSNSVWMPQIIGLLFPIGLLSLSIASKIWLMATVGAFGAIVYTFIRRAQVRPWLAALLLLLLFSFSPVVHHMDLGQFSVFIVLLFLLAAAKPQAYLRSGLLCALAMTKPQLCILAVPGLFIFAYRTGRFGGVLRLGASNAAWIALLLAPLYLQYPNWIPGMVAALQSNAEWAQPSSLHHLSLALGPGMGRAAWLAWFLLIFCINAALWVRLAPEKAMAWSMAITCLVSPYIWSWDFVFLLPCFLMLLVQARRFFGKAFLVTGFLLGSFLIWKVRWGVQISDEVFVWVPFFYTALYVLSSWMTARDVAAGAVLPNGISQNSPNAPRRTPTRSTAP
jgi:hypothetical protein